jgi:hypothetical protein
MNNLNTTRPDLKDWRSRLESEGKNPPKAEDLYWEAEPGIRIDPVYEAASLGPEHAYLAGFHRYWASLPRPARPGIRVSWVQDSLPEGLEEETTRAGIDSLYNGFAGSRALYGPQSYRAGLSNKPSGLAEAETDPVFDSLREGQWLPGWKENTPLSPSGLWIHASDIHRAGGSPTDELTMALRVADEYRKRLTDADYRAGVDSWKIQLGVGPSFWLEIAKFRAMRLLWMHYTRQLGLEGLPGFIEAETSTVYWSCSDPDSNLIRHSSEVLSALLGGVDSVLVHPHTTDPDLALDALRQAANLVWLPLKESQLEGVFDPVSGSYLAEILTHKLASSAWNAFVSTQNKSLTEELEQGDIQEEIARKGAGFTARYREGKAVLTGANYHPSPLSRPCKTLSVHMPVDRPSLTPLRPLVLDAS